MLLSIPPPCLTFVLGDENTLEKSGKVFLAIEFLLSPDRDHFVSGLGLRLRYLVVHCSFAGGVFVVQYLLDRVFPKARRIDKQESTRGYLYGLRPGLE